MRDISELKRKKILIACAKISYNNFPSAFTISSRGEIVQNSINKQLSARAYNTLIGGVNCNNYINNLYQSLIVIIVIHIF